MKPIALATEDSLSEDVGRKLIAEAASDFDITLSLRKGGNGYLKTNIAKFLEISQQIPLLLITDLDTETCAPKLRGDWLGKRQAPKKFLFRVAVREIESWLLADHAAMQKFLGISLAKMPLKPDSLSDPKQALLNLAGGAGRDIRGDLLAAKGAIASQGLGYNNRLGLFVREMWSPARAAARSDSLARTRQRLKQLAQSLR